MTHILAKNQVKGQEAPKLRIETKKWTDATNFITFFTKAVGNK